MAAEEGAERVATQEGAERVFGHHGCYVNKISATISHPHVVSMQLYVQTARAPLPRTLK